MSYSQSSTFERDTDQPQDRLGTMDERCRNCRHAFGEHHNGRCPLDEEEDE